MGYTMCFAAMMRPQRHHEPIGAGVWSFRSAIIPVNLLIRIAEKWIDFAEWAWDKQEYANEKESEWKNWGRDQV
ncbi:hypothetical protein PG985_015935 [Apiospora marii]|uniref:Uncharacterized protein n=1 Tax=Apiospora marii TaxID=335849 RepID=A0ABR1S3Z3_9PEZI